MSAPILVLLAHSELRHSRICRRLAQEARARPEVEVRDLYALWPDYVIDVEAEQRAVEAAARLVWLHPVQWYSMPALMKLWLDEVLLPGWAHGRGGRALQGKELWPVLSTGGHARDYRPGGRHGHDFADFLRPYERVAALCGMRWRAPMVLHGAASIDDAALAVHAREFVHRLTAPVPAGPRGD